MTIRTVSVIAVPPDCEPAMITTASPDWAMPASLILAIAKSQSSSMSDEGDMKTSWTPQELFNWRAVDSLGVIAMIGIGGRKREMARAVMPERVQATMATAFSSIAARHAAPVIAAVMRVDWVPVPTIYWTPSEDPHLA